MLERASHGGTFSLFGTNISWKNDCCRANDVVQSFHREEDGIATFINRYTTFLKPHLRKRETDLKAFEKS